MVLSGHMIHMTIYVLVVVYEVPQSPQETPGDKQIDRGKRVRDMTTPMTYKVQKRACGGRWGGGQGRL
jgi:hypothetical protein